MGEKHPQVSISSSLPSVCTVCDVLVLDSSARPSWRPLKCHPSTPATERSPASASMYQRAFLAPVLCSPSLSPLSLALLAGLQSVGVTGKAEPRAHPGFQADSQSLCFRLSPYHQFASKHPLPGAFRHPSSSHPSISYSPTSRASKLHSSC